MNKNKESFKDFLIERSNIIELIGSLSVPVLPGMMDRLGFSEHGIAYRVMNSKYLPDLIKKQGKKNNLSAFTDGGYAIARVPSQPDMLVKLEGTILINGETDLWSKRDQRGILWLDQDRRVPGNKLSFYLQGIIDKLNKNIGPLNDISSKDQIRYYKEYIQEVERYLDQGGYKELNDYLKKASNLDYNEVIITRYKILEVSSLEFDRAVIINIAKENNIPYGGVKSYHDIKKIKP